MAEILPFPAGRRADAPRGTGTPEAGAAGDRPEEDTWPGDDPEDDPEDGGIGLARVAGLAAAPPAPSLDALLKQVADGLEAGTLVRSRDLGVRRVDDR